MNDLDKPHYKKPDQKRSIKTIEDILDAAKLISDEGLAQLLNARTLSSRSGYSIGAIYRYFEKIDDVFLELLKRRISKGIAILKDIIDSHDKNLEAVELAKKIADSGINEWSNRNPKIIRMVVRQFFKHSKEPEKYNAAIDVLTSSMLELQKRDCTGTFRSMTELEARLSIRAIQMAIRNPFIECDPVAGSEEHRECVVQISMRLFSKPAGVENFAS